MILALNTVNNFTQFLSLLIIFVFVLAITYFTTKFIANYQKGKLNDSNIKVLEGARITQKQFIQIVQIGKKYYALGISKDNMTVICEIPKDDLKFCENDNANIKFADIFSKISKKDLNDKDSLVEDNSIEDNSVNSSKESEAEVKSCDEDKDKEKDKEKDKDDIKNKRQRGKKC